MQRARRVIHSGAAAPRMATMQWPKGWNVSADGKRVETKVETEDFLAAMKLLNDLAPVAEKLEHHPDLHVEQWNHVRIVSYSHDVGHLTERDEKLAAEIEKVLAKHGLR
ncbi:MAG: 4a-hydroxytetrahydrobiopterin dehydratase [Thermoplasmata archaeon]|jgi:4a-hydroxytetrahydrobiopterin dehydratase|nr:4a-hydroxytetrahydrobiopterin dehydratase [Thermoplasmata archaeon]